MTEIDSQLKTALADRYKLDRQLGQGGMATVYLAHDLKHDRKVALKVLKPELAALLGAERFLSEIKVTANLQHPNILALYDSGEADSFLYYVMPLVEGDTLRDKLNRERQLSVEDTIQIARSVAAALDYAHEQGVIHRDIKPENILLQRGQALVADFGIALAVNQAGGTRLTGTGLSLGTPRYMSPEQATGDRILDGRTDTYSLAATLYEMLAGRPPFDAATQQALVAKIVTQEPDLVTRDRSSVPAHVEAAIHKALAKLPADRFASASEFAAALSDTSFTLSTGVSGLPRLATARTWKRVAIAMAIVAAVTSGMLVLGGMQPDAVTLTSRQRIVLWAGQVTPTDLNRGSTMAPDGSAIVFVDTVGSQPQLFIKERNQALPTPIPGTLNGSGPFFSPDGQWIAFRLGAKLNRVPRNGGSVVTIADSTQQMIPAGAWLDDGTIVFARDGKLMRVDATNEDVVPVSDSTFSNPWYMSPLPSGRAVLLTTCGPGCRDPSVKVVDLRTGTVQTLLQGVLRASYARTGHLIYVRPDGGMFAVGFDAERLTLRGETVLVVDGVSTYEVATEVGLTVSGTLLYLAGPQVAPAGQAEAVWVTRDGTAEAIDSTWRIYPSYRGGMSLSPDGSMVALAVADGPNTDVWVKRLPVGVFTRLTVGDATEFRPTWTADGRSVAYVLNDSGTCSVFVRPADGSRPAEPVLDPALDACAARWSSDGRWIVYQTGADGPHMGDIFAIRSGEDTIAVPLVATTFNEVSPALSPDDRFLAYVSDESGRPEVYVRPFPNVEDARWQVSTAGGTLPLWSNSGEELFFVNGDAQMVAATIQASPRFTARSRVLFEMRAVYAGMVENPDGILSYDISPDDQRFLALRGVGLDKEDSPARFEVVLVENFFEELKAKIGNK